MKTSVIIPTVDRREHLNVLLNSLARGTLLPDEVVIVEQGDVEDTRKGLVSLPFPVKILAHDEKSSATARNLGVRKATGEILFFFDDDIEINPDYLQNALDYLCANPQVLGLTGQFEGEKPRPPWRLWVACLFNVHSPRASNIVLPSGSTDFIRGANAHNEQEVEWMRGGNMVLRRNAFDEAFQFNPHFSEAVNGHEHRR